MMMVSATRSWRSPYGLPAGRYGSGIAIRRNIRAFRLLHRLGILFPLVIVSQEVQEAVHGKVGDMMGERLALAAGLSFDRFIGHDDVADKRRIARSAAVGNDRTFVAASTPRQSRLSRRIAESSVSTITSSALGVDNTAAA